MSAVIRQDAPVNGDSFVANPKELMINEAAGRVLSDLRNDLGLTQDEAAELLGVSRRTIVKYESGEGNKFDQIFQYARAYGVDEVKFAVLMKMKRRVASIDPDNYSDQLLAAMLADE